MLKLPNAVSCITTTISLSQPHLACGSIRLCGSPTPHLRTVPSPSCPGRRNPSPGMAPGAAVGRGGGGIGVPVSRLHGASGAGGAATRTVTSRVWRASPIWPWCLPRMGGGIEGPDLSDERKMKVSFKEGCCWDSDCKHLHLVSLSLLCSFLFLFGFSHPPWASSPHRFLHPSRHTKVHSGRNSRSDYMFL